MFSMDRNVFWRFRNIFSEKLLLDEEKTDWWNAGRCAGLDAAAGFSQWQRNVRPHGYAPVYAGLYVLFGPYRHSHIQCADVAPPSLKLKMNWICWIAINDKGRRHNYWTKNQLLYWKQTMAWCPMRSVCWMRFVFFHNNDAFCWFCKQNRFSETKVSDVFEDLSAARALKAVPTTSFTFQGLATNRLPKPAKKTLQWFMCWIPISWRPAATALTFAITTLKNIPVGGLQHYYYRGRPAKLPVEARRSDTHIQWVTTVFGIWVSRWSTKGQNATVFIRGRVDKPYHISDFMLRPTEINTRIIGPSKKDTAFNNFPD